jgi:hypothetical protein
MLLYYYAASVDYLLVVHMAGVDIGKMALTVIGFKLGIGGKQ